MGPVELGLLWFAMMTRSMGSLMGFFDGEC